MGANQELLAAIASWEQPEIEKHAADSQITWHFNVPINPHAGGLWERCVRSVKHHLNRAGGSTSFSYEELTTLLARIAMCLNSRPLSSMSDDPLDLTVLTPGHFLVVGPMMKPAAPDYTEIPPNRLNGWQRIHQLQQQFWRRRREECIIEQQSRNKWLHWAAQETERGSGRLGISPEHWLTACTVAHGTDN